MLKRRVLDKGNEMYSFIEFINSEDGAITVDWVVLTAVIVGLGVSVAALVGSGTITMSENVGTSLSEATPPDLEMPFPNTGS